MLFIWYLSLGCNVCDCVAGFSRLLNLIDNSFDALLLTLPVIETESWVAEINFFINSCIKLVTSNSVWFLIARAKFFERYVTRGVRFRWLDRLIDIDIIWGSNYIKINKLSVPHIYLNDRKFVVTFVATLFKNLFLHKLLCVLI
ncbi:2-amino-4-hydroxy-6-hydroxymethyldihydropteridine diphosphokinase [Candidatus Hodgkinia cicadicola]|nr:2-amino-4-hydroxy-6-hydroxymethyldihydropteridine diphosphokinase [Candidatus Hodgkinia cicadicola]